MRPRRATAISIKEQETILAELRSIMRRFDIGSSTIAKLASIASHSVPQ